MRLTLLFRKALQLELLPHIGFIVIGMAILIWGGNLLVDGAGALARRLGVSNIVIGMTVVAFGTSAPELAVNVFAAIDQNSGIVLGNVVGSNIFNVLAILGISAIFYPLSVRTKTVWIEIPLSLLAALIMLGAAADSWLDGSAEPMISRSDGIICLLFFLVFMRYNLHLIREEPERRENIPENLSLGKSIFYMVIGLVFLVIGGRGIVIGASEIARSLEISERVIAILIVSAGTSLPELATSLIAARKKNVDLAIGNVVGSNIFNVFLVLGVSATIHPIQVVPGSIADILVNVGASLLLFLFVLNSAKRQLVRWEGLVFVVLFVAYLTGVVMGI